MYIVPGSAPAVPRSLSLPPSLQPFFLAPSDPPMSGLPRIYVMICTIVLLLLEIPGFPRSCPAFSTQLLLSRVECFSSPLTKGKRVLAVAMMQLVDRSQRWCFLLSLKGDFIRRYQIRITV